MTIITMLDPACFKYVLATPNGTQYVWGTDLIWHNCVTRFSLLRYMGDLCTPQQCNGVCGGTSEHFDIGDGLAVPGYRTSNRTTTLNLFDTVSDSSQIIAADNQGRLDRRLGRTNWGGAHFGDNSRLRAAYDRAYNAARPKWTR